MSNHTIPIEETVEFNPNLAEAFRLLRKVTELHPDRDLLITKAIEQLIGIPIPVHRLTYNRADLLKLFDKIEQFPVLQFRIKRLEEQCKVAVEQLNVLRAHYEGQNNPEQTQEPEAAPTQEVDASSARWEPTDDSFGRLIQELSSFNPEITQTGYPYRTYYIQDNGSPVNVSISSNGRGQAHSISGGSGGQAHSLSPVSASRA